MNTTNRQNQGLALYALQQVGDIPSGWKVSRNIGLFDERIERAGDEECELLSVSISNGVTKQSDRKSIKKDSSNEDKSNYKKVNVGDIAYNKMRMWQGAVGCSDYDGIVSPAYIILKPKKYCNPRYFYYLFKTKLYNELAYQFGHGIVDDQHSLRYWQFKGLYSFLPPIDTQKQIADFLDEKTAKIDKIIVKKQKLIKLLKEKRISFITKAVTRGIDPKVKMKASEVEWIENTPEDWKAMPLKSLMAYHSGGAWGEEPKLNDNDIVCIRVADFIFLTLNTKTEDLTLRNLQNLKTTLLLDKATILLEKSGGGDQQPVGRAVRYLEQDKAICSNFIQKLQLKSEYNAQFIVFLLTALYHIGVTRKAIKQTTGIQNLDIDHFLKTLVFLPSVREQNEISAYIERASKLVIETVDRIEGQIEKLSEYRSSLIHNAVAGKIKA